MAMNARMKRAFAIVNGAHHARSLTKRAHMRLIAGAIGVNRNRGTAVTQALQTFLDRLYLYPGS